jgi:thioredoxin 1
MSDTAALSRDLIRPWIRESTGPVFVDVWGPRCQPCLALAPTYEQLAQRHGAEASFLSLEAPANRMACVDLAVMGLPTFLVFVGGEERDRLSGESITPSQLEEWVSEHIKENDKGGEE